MAEKYSAREGRLPRTWENGEDVSSDSRWWCSGFFPGVLWYVYENGRNPRVLEVRPDVHRARRAGETHHRQPRRGVHALLQFRQRAAPHGRQVLRGGAAHRGALAGDALQARSGADPLVGPQPRQMAVSGHHRQHDEPRTADVGRRPFGRPVRCATWPSRTPTRRWNTTSAPTSARGTWSPTTRSRAGPTSSRPTRASPTPRPGAAGRRGDSTATPACTASRATPATSQQARGIAGFLINHRNMPADGIPYWDFDAPALASTPRDASAAAIMASALVELSGFVPAAGGRASTWPSPKSRSARWPRPNTPPRRAENGELHPPAQHGSLSLLLGGRRAAHLRRLLLPGGAHAHQTPTAAMTAVKKYALLPLCGLALFCARAQDARDKLRRIAGPGLHAARTR